MSDLQYLTYKYRIKDSTSKKHLKVLAGTTNFVWNYINNLSYQSIKKNYIWLSEYDINKFLADKLCKELKIHSTTLQEISATYVKSRKQFRKSKLRFRTAKHNKSLGWIPFKSSAIKLESDVITYNKQQFRFYKSRELPENAKIKTGCFVQDSRDRWYLCITFSILKTTEKHPNPGSEIGIDLGIKNKITLSNGTAVYNRENIIKQYEDKLAKAQRANKKRQVRNLHAKIKNIRTDFAHKTTTEIAKEFETIYVGDLESNKILTEINNVNKAIYDAGLYQIKNFLNYKTSRLGGSLKLVAENYTTITCSNCEERTGPSGKEDLNIREWTCAECLTFHQRDINSACNILRIGHYTP